MTSFAEGDINSEERGTCARANGGKVQFSLFPMHLLAGACRVFMHGAIKYAAWNWTKGGRWSTAFDCMMRHMLKWWFCGEDFDAESGQHHLDHALCNLMFLIHYKDTYAAGDDRPPAMTHFAESLAGINKLFVAKEPPAQEPAAKEQSDPCEGCEHRDACLSYRAKSARRHSARTS